ncbi:MAG: hypothetical protein PHV02_15920 [Rhodocyclaceae bacterium]|nr:hypothetical protein [Rhodocyclaceae bacterium]
MTPDLKSERSLLPLLVTSMAVIAPLLFILGLVVGNQLQGNSSLSADSVSSWVSAIATVAIAILTFVLAKETWYLREVQMLQVAELKRENIRPNVSVQLERSHVGINFHNVKVSNLGKGIAKRIAFTFFDRAGNAVDDDQDVIVNKFRKLAIFRQGIESMGIGQTLSSFVLNFIELHRELNGEIFKGYLNILVSFEDVEGNPYTNTFAIDFAQFEGISELGGGDALYQLATETKKIQEHLGRMARHSNGRIAVDVFNTADRQAEEEETKAWLNEQRGSK